MKRISDYEKVLYLSLKKEWFDLIRSGKKKVEYREYKPYWYKRLENKEYDLIEFRNGYGKDVPRFRAAYEGFGILEGESNPLDLPKVYTIYIGSLECNRCYDFSNRLYPWYYTDDLGIKQVMFVCWDCDFDLCNGRGSVYDSAYEIEEDRRIEAYENDPINEPYPYPINGRVL